MLKSKIRLKRMAVQVNIGHSLYVCTSPEGTFVIV
jgi:hypothetical protein